MQTQITIKGSNNYELLNLKRVGKSCENAIWINKNFTAGKENNFIFFVKSRALLPTWNNVDQFL